MCWQLRINTRILDKDGMYCSSNIKKDKIINKDEFDFQDWIETRRNEPLFRKV